MIPSRAIRPPPTTSHVSPASHAHARVALPARTSARGWHSVAKKASFAVAGKPHTGFAKTLACRERIPTFKLPSLPAVPLLNRVNLNIPKATANLGRRLYHYLSGSQADKHKIVTKSISQSLPVPRQIREGLKKSGCVRVSGGAATGKTEQVQIALGKDHKVFDLKEAFLADYIKKHKIPKDQQDKIRNSYATGKMKKLELNYLIENRKKIVDLLAKSPEKTIVMDEFDLANDEKLSDTELDSAQMMVRIAKELKQKGKNIVFILHAAGLKNEMLTQYMEQQHLISRDDPVIYTHYLDSTSQSMILDTFPLNPYENQRITEIGHGMPSVFLDFYKDSAKLALEEESSQVKVPEFKDILRDSYKTIKKQWEIVQKTESKTICQILVDLATHKIEIDDERVLKHKDALLFTGLVGEPNGQLVMSKMVRDTIQNSLDTEEMKSKFTYEEPTVDEVRKLPSQEHIPLEAVELCEQMTEGSYLTRDFEGAPVFLPKNPFVINELWERHKVQINSHFNFEGLPQAADHREYLYWKNTATTPEELLQHAEAVKDPFLSLLNEVSSRTGAQLITGYDKKTGQHKHLIKSRRSLDLKISKLKRAQLDPVLATQEINDPIRATFTASYAGQLSEVMRTFNQLAKEKYGCDVVFENRWTIYYSSGYVGVHANILIHGVDKDGKPIQVKGELQFHLSSILDETETCPKEVAHRIYDLSKMEKFGKNPIFTRKSEEAMKAIFAAALDKVPQG